MTSMNLEGPASSGVDPAILWLLYDYERGNVSVADPSRHQANVALLVYAPRGAPPDLQAIGQWKQMSASYWTADVPLCQLRRVLEHRNVTAVSK